jgi:hypothetical protein
MSAANPRDAFPRAGWHWRPFGLAQGGLARQCTAPPVCRSSPPRQRRVMFPSRARATPRQRLCSARACPSRIWFHDVLNKARWPFLATARRARMPAAPPSFPPFSVSLQDFSRRLERHSAPWSLLFVASPHSLGVCFLPLPQSPPFSARRPRPAASPPRRALSAFSALKPPAILGPAAEGEKPGRAEKFFSSIGLHKSLFCKDLPPRHRHRKPPKKFGLTFAENGLY